MTSLADQLKGVQLKKSSEKMKDSSKPKTSGFTSDEEIFEYQNTVIDVNTETWLDLLQDVTFRTAYCRIEKHEAELFVSVYSRIYENLDSVGISQLNWRNKLTPEEVEIVDSMTSRLSSVMEEFTKDGGCAFVKTSSRSPKDAPLAQTQFRDLYEQKLSEFTESERSEENTQIICLLQAGFDALRVKTAEEVLDMMMRSERIFQDMMLALAIKDRFSENFVVREFVAIDVDMEFRGFVFQNKLVALSQYNYLIYSENLVKKKLEIEECVLKFFNNEVIVRLKNSPLQFPDNFIIDFAICNNGQTLWVIEINPFLETTDGALFSWQQERHLLEGSEGFTFRIVTKPKPGSTAMLPTSVKALLK